MPNYAASHRYANAVDVAYRGKLNASKQSLVKCKRGDTMLARWFPLSAAATEVQHRRRTIAWKLSVSACAAHSFSPWRGGRDRDWTCDPYDVNV